MVSVEIELNPFGYTRLIFRSSRPEVFYKKLFLEISQNSLENTCARVSFLVKLQVQACNFIKKKLWQVFSCEFYEISKNTFSYTLATISLLETLPLIFILINSFLVSVPMLHSLKTPNTKEHQKVFCFLSGGLKRSTD